LTEQGLPEIFTRDIKVWISITLFSLLVWIAYWTPTSIERAYNFTFVRWDIIVRNIGALFAISEIGAGIGTALRSVGVLLGFLSLFIVWRGRHDFFSVRKLVASALAIEGFYYAMLFPSGLLMLGVGGSVWSIPLGVAYLLQVLFTVPFLAILAFKVYTYKKEPNGFQSWMWIGLAFSGYVIALWANSVLRWVSMASSEGILYLLSGSTAGGFLSSAILMSLAIVFSIIGALKLSGLKMKSSFKWLGLALTMIGLQYVIYVLYHHYYGMLSFVWLSDPWTMPLLGLGLSLLVFSFKDRGISPSAATSCP
jgi:hypothetical protein